MQHAYDFGWRIYDLWWSAIDSLDQKAASLAGFAAVLLGLSFFGAPGSSALAIRSIVYLLGCAAVLGAAFFAINAWRIRTLSLPGKPADVTGHCKDERHSEQAVLAMLSNTLDIACHKLEPAAQAKAKSLKVGYWLLLAGMSLLLLSRMLAL